MSSKGGKAGVGDGGKGGLVPKLRFPEFRGVEEWEVKKLVALVQLVSGMHLSPEQYGKEGATPYFTGPSDFTNQIEAITKRTSDSTSLAKKDDTLITVKGSGVGEIWYLTLSSVAIGRQLMAVRAINAESRFVFQFLLTKRQRFEDLAAGNLIPGLSRGDILDVAAPFPQLLEQQKIADCLSSLDELIAAQARKLEALKAHKKGLMQQLFPREGETQPRLRFPEFLNDFDWRETKFREVVAKCFYGTSQPTLKKGQYPVLRMGNMGGGQLDFSNLVYLDLKAAEFEKIRLHWGDILLNRTNSHDLVGKISLFDCGIECTMASYIVAYRLKLDLILPRFCNYLLNTERFQKRIKVFATIGVSQSNINPTTLQESLAITLPGPTEQQRIAECLGCLDALITAEAQKLESLKTHKRGLMQQLFPSPEDIEA